MNTSNAVDILGHPLCSDHEEYFQTAFGNNNIPFTLHQSMREFIPANQRARIKEAGTEQQKSTYLADFRVELIRLK